MSLTIFTPLLYLLIGLICGRLPVDIKRPASALLTLWVIPLVIVYNIATHRPGVFAVMVGMMAIMAAMLALSRSKTRDPVQNLCFFYLNVGWLGLPVAGTLFGDGAAMVIISAYIGNSLFGNSIGVGLLAEGEDRRSRILRTLRAPPVWAMLVGLLCMPFGRQVEAWGTPLYEVLKFAMGLLGMGILGIWLSGTRLRPQDFRLAVGQFARRSLAMLGLVTLFVLACRPFDIALVRDNLPTLYLLCLLPPAANIIVLETHYLKSGRSASLIACGTCVSIIAIAVYAAAVLTLRHVAPLLP